MKSKKLFLIHVIIWIVLVFIISILLYTENGNIPKRFQYRMGFNLCFFYINYILLVPFLLLKKKKIAYFASALILLIISSFLFNTILTTPEVVHNFKATKSLPIVFTSLFLVVGTAIRIYEEWTKNETHKKEIEAQKNISELEVLKNKLNPHFLFNSLNSIYWLTKHNPKQASEAVITLSELIRYMLYTANENTVLLKDEVEYIENYIRLQRLRIANNENVTLNISGQICKQKISPSLFIPYIENAFKYGTDFSGKTEVKIEITIKNETLLFKCTNLIESKTKDKCSPGIGMQISNERLQSLYPKKHWLTIEEKENNFIVELKLKLY